MNDSSVSQYKFNIPTDLKVRLQDAADRNGRSLSSEIITRLQASVMLSEEINIDFTEDAVLTYLGEVVKEYTDPLERRIEELEQAMRGVYRMIP